LHGTTAKGDLRLHTAVFLLSFSESWNAGNVGPIVHSLASDLSASLGGIGLLSGTLFFTGVVVATLLGAELGRRIPIGVGLRGACALGAAGNVLCALSPGFAGLAAGRLLAGLALGAAFLFGGAFTRAVGGSRLIGVFGVGVTGGIAVALALGSVLEDAGVDWRVAFAISALVALSPLPFLPRTMPTVAPKAEPGEGLWREALTSLPMWKVLGLGLASFSVPLVVGSWLVAYLSDGGMSTSLAGALGFVLFAVSAGCRDLSGRMLAGGTGPGALSLAGCLVGAAGLAVLAIDTSLGPALAAVVLMGAGLALPYALVYDEGERAIAERPLGGLGITLAGSNALPIFVVPVVGSALAAGNGDLAWIGLAAFTVMVGVINVRPALPPSA
jgi:predicted MFS family arabinose efflux permease